MTDLTLEQLAELAHLASLNVTSAVQEDEILRAAPQLIAMARRTAEAEERAEIEAQCARMSEEGIGVNETIDRLHIRIADLERRLAEALALLDEVIPAWDESVTGAPAVKRWIERRAAIDAPTEVKLKP